MRHLTEYELWASKLLTSNRWAQDSRSRAIIMFWEKAGVLREENIMRLRAVVHFYDWSWAENTQRKWSSYVLKRFVGSVVDWFDGRKRGLGKNRIERYVWYKWRTRPFHVTTAASTASTSRSSSNHLLNCFLFHNHLSHKTKSRTKAFRCLEHKASLGSLVCSLGQILLI